MRLRRMPFIAPPMVKIEAAREPDDTGKHLERSHLLPILLLPLGAGGGIKGQTLIATRSCRQEAAFSQTARKG